MSQSTRDITIPIGSASIFRNYNQEGTSGLRAPQAVRLDSNSNFGDFPAVFSRAPESHFFLNNPNNTMLNRQELTISEQVTPCQNKPIISTASPKEGEHHGKRLFPVSSLSIIQLESFKRTNGLTMRVARIDHHQERTGPLWRALERT